MRASLFLAAFAVVIAAAAAQNGCDGTVNNHKFIDGGHPALLKTVKNGKLYQIGTEEGSTLRVMHLWGTPYENGVAQGELLKDEIKEMLTAFYQYLEDEMTPYLKWLPADVRKIIEDKGITAALQFEVDMTREFIADTYFEEIHGLANATGIDFDDLLRLNLFPELIKASCTIMGATGAALGNASEHLVQLRALDWGLDNPLLNYSVVTIYHPNEGNGHDFATVGFAAFVGSVTSYSNHVGMSEKVWLSYNETYTRKGVPFHFLIRDAAQYDMAVDDVLNRIYNNPRTCSIHLGVGSISENQFRLVEYSHEEVFVYDDQNFPAYLPEHPQLDGLVYVDKHVQPSHHTCLGSLMQKYHGSITPELVIRDIVGVHATGDMHAAVYDFTENIMWVSVAGANVTDSGKVIGGPVAPAHARPWFRLDTAVLFAEKQ